MYFLLFVVSTLTQTTGMSISQNSGSSVSCNSVNGKQTCFENGVPVNSQRASVLMSQNQQQMRQSQLKMDNMFRNNPFFAPIAPISIPLAGAGTSVNSISSGTTGGSSISTSSMGNFGPGTANSIQCSTINGATKCYKNNVPVNPEEMKKLKAENDKIALNVQNNIKATQDRINSSFNSMLF